MIIGISGKISSGKDTIGRIIQILTSDDYKQGFINNEAIVQRLKETSFRTVGDNSSFEIKKFAYKLKAIVSILTGISIEDLEKEEVKNSTLGEEWKFNIDGFTIHNKYKELGGHGVFIGNESQATRDKERIVEMKLQEFIELSKTPYTVRQLLQKIGTEAMRDVIHEQVWVNALFGDYTKKDRNLHTLVDPKIFEGEDYEENFDETYPNWIITDVRFSNEARSIKDRKGILIRVNRETEWNEISPLDNRHNHPSEISLDNYTFDYTIDNNSSIEDLIEKVKQILIKEKII